MDTEEDLKIQHAIRTGKSETDEGPYYHDSWWESYKGSVKGKLGGGAIGAIIGGLVGVVAAAAIVATGGAALGVAGTIVGGFAAAGMLYGSHEFSDVGKVTGAVSAAQERNESRMKSFEEKKFTEIKNEIGDIKRMLGGEPVVAKKDEPAQAGNTSHGEHYKTQHCDDGHCPPNQRKLIFWKIALIGLVVGMAAGGLLAFAGASAHILGALGAAEGTISTMGTYVASMTVLGLAGASYGINRDVFRQIFDKTDLLFKGLLEKSNHKYQALSQAPAQEQVPTVAKEAPVTTFVYDGALEYPKSDTYHRDKVLASAKQALLSMDHTKSIPH